MSVDHEHHWAIVLAAGEGTRLRALTTSGDGVAVPKQFCSLRGGESLLRSAFARARQVVGFDRIVTVVAREHADWWVPDLAGTPRRNVVVQPRPRGTATGLLLPLVDVLFRDPDAFVAVFPSDHYVAREEILARALDEAFEAAHAFGVVLLGITPESPETEYGWILPAGRARPSRVTTFVEKPHRGRATELRRDGALWNSFILVARGGALLDLYEETHPELVDSLLDCLGREGWMPGTLESLYERLPERDFSRDVLARAPEALRVLEVPLCGWTDLGTPERVQRCLAADPNNGQSRFEGVPAAGPDLSRSLERARAREPIPSGTLRTGGL